MLDSGNILLYSKGGRCFAAASDSYIAAAIAMLCSSQNLQGHVLAQKVGVDRSQEVAHLLYSSAALQQVTGKDILQILRGSVDAICFAAAVGVGLRCAFTAQYHGLQDRAAESPRRFHHQDLGQSDMKGQQSMQFPLWGSMLACRLSLLGISC